MKGVTIIINKIDNLVRHDNFPLPALGEETCKHHVPEAAPTGKLNAGHISHSTGSNGAFDVSAGGVSGVVDVAVVLLFFLLLMVVVVVVVVVVVMAILLVVFDVLMLAIVRVLMWKWFWFCWQFWLGRVIVGQNSFRKKAGVYFNVF